MMKIATLLGILALTPAFAGGVVSSNGTLHGRDVLTLENGEIRVSVTPGIGGRVLEFSNLKTGHGAAKVRMDNIAKKPDDNWAGADYGGFCDAPVPGLGWPGDFWGLTYDLKLEDGKDGAKSLVATAQAKDIGIERRMTVFPDSTMLRVETKLTNLGKLTQKMRVRFHCEMAQGERGDDNDKVFYPSPEGMKMVDYAVGAEYARMEVLKVAGGWVSLSDTAGHESVFKLLRADGPQDVFYWAGANEATEIVGSEGAFVGLDWLGKEQDVAPGDSISSVEDLFLANGIGRPDFVDTADGIAGEVTTDRKIYGKSGSVAVRCALASAQALQPAMAKISIVQAENPLASLESKIPASAPGKASSSTAKWDYSDLKDGTYQIKAVFTDGSSKEIGTVEKTFEINGALVESVTNSLDAAAKTLEDLKRKVKAGGQDKALDVSTEIKILDSRIAEVRDFLKAGAYDQMSRALTLFAHDAEKLQNLLKEKIAQ